MRPIFLALGSNLGDRSSNLQRAVELLPPKVRILAQSPIYETAPWGYVEQPCFLNQVIQAETLLSPLDLLKFVKKTEIHLGRKPAIRYGPRVIDLDILFYDDLVIHSSQLTIPHPRMHERAFVLVPFADIAPDFVHPVFQETISALLSRVDTSGVNPYEPGSQ